MADLMNLEYYPAITANPGGGQANAVTLRQGVNRITTVATAADSVKLPSSVTGQIVFVINAAAANSANVFPDSGGTINALAPNAAFAVAAGKTAMFVCATTGQWVSILTA